MFTISSFMFHCDYLVKSKITLGMIMIGMSLLAAEVAAGARFPNAVEKKIVITGPSADSVAKLLGLSRNISLRLGKPEAWAVYNLKQDTPERIWNYEDAPARYNTIEYSPSRGSWLAISPYWLDLGTAIPARLTGAYRFGSPVLREESDKTDPWMKILRRLKSDPEWNGASETRFVRCFSSLEGISLCIKVFRVS